MCVHTIYMSTLSFYLFTADKKTNIKIMGGRQGGQWQDHSAMHSPRNCPHAYRLPWICGCGHVAHLAYRLLYLKQQVIKEFYCGGLTLCQLQKKKEDAPFAGEIHCTFFQVLPKVIQQKRCGAVRMPPQARQLLLPFHQLHHSAHCCCFGKCRHLCHVHYHHRLPPTQKQMGRCCQPYQ